MSILDNEIPSLSWEYVLRKPEERLIEELESEATKRRKTLFESAVPVISMVAEVPGPVQTPATISEEEEEAVTSFDSTGA